MSDRKAANPDGGGRLPYARAHPRWLFALRDVSNGAKLLWLELSWTQGPRDLYSFKSEGRLARDLGYRSRRQIGRLVEELEHHDPPLLHVDRSDNGRVNHYTVLVPPTLLSGGADSSRADDIPDTHLRRNRPGGATSPTPTPDRNVPVEQGSTREL